MQPRSVTALGLALMTVASGPVALRAQNRPVHGGAPAVSPDGRAVAFTADRDGQHDIWVVDPNGKRERRVTNTEAPERNVGWLGGGEIVFSLVDGDSGRIYAIRPDGTGQRLLGTVAGRSPVLSPDGRRVAFLTGPWSSTALVVAQADGSRGRIIAGGKTTAWNPAWSPDGRRIAYTYGDSTRVLQVHVVNADGTGDHAVTHMTAEQGSAQLPAWSPDGRRLAFQVNNRQTHSASIWLVDLANRMARELIPHDEPWADEIPAWFPDGRRIAFQSDRSGAIEIWITTVAGDPPLQLTR